MHMKIFSDIPIGKFDININVYKIADIQSSFETFKLLKIAFEPSFVGLIDTDHFVLVHI